MAFGSVVPVLSSSWTQQGAGLLLPPGRTSVHQGVELMLTLGDYLGVDDNSVFDAAEDLADEIVSQHRRTDLLLVLAVLNLVRVKSELNRELAQAFTMSISGEPGRRLRTLLDPEAERPRRLLSRQGILAAMKKVLCSPVGPDDRSPGVPLRNATLLVHAVSTSLAAGAGPDSDKLMVMMTQNLLFNAPRDLMEEGTRHIDMFERVGPSITREPLTASPVGLVRDATDLEPRDYLAYAVAASEPVLSWEPGRDPTTAPNLGLDDPLPTLERFLSHTARDVDGLATAVLDQREAGTDTAWNFLPFERTPLLMLPQGDVLVLDMQMLASRVTEGIFWDVHDHLKDRDGEQARRAWTQVWGDMVEHWAVDRLPALAPAALEGHTYWSPGDLETAYPRTSTCDAAVEVAPDMLLLEAVGGRFTFKTRARGMVPALRDDVEKLVMKKARQLDATARSVLRNEQSLTGYPQVRGRTIQPLVITGCQWPANPLLRIYIESECNREKLFTDPRVASLAVIGLDELGALEQLSAAGSSPVQAIRDWQASNLRDMPLRNWLAREASPAHGSEDAWEELVPDLMSRLGMTESS